MSSTKTGQAKHSRMKQNRIILILLSVGVAVISLLGLRTGIVLASSIRADLTVLEDTSLITRSDLNGLLAPRYIPTASKGSQEFAKYFELLERAPKSDDVNEARIQRRALLNEGTVNLYGGALVGESIFGMALPLLTQSLESLSWHHVTDTNSSWPMYLYDAAHTGYNPVEENLHPPLELNWAFGPPGTWANLYGSIAVATADTVYVFMDGPDDEATIYALEPETGSVVWYRSFPQGSVVGNLALGDEYLFAPVYLWNSGGMLYALSPATGNLEWQATLTRTNISRSVVDNTSLYYIDSAYNGAPTYDYTLTAYAIDQETGSTLWSYTRTRDTLFPGNPIAVNGVLLFSDGGETHSEEDYIVALDTSTGQELWTQAHDNDTWYSELVGNVTENVVYAFGGHDSGNQEITAFDVDTGSIAWNYQYGTGYSSVTPLLADGNLYHIAWLPDGQYMYRFDAATGTVESTTQIPSVFGDYVYITMANGVIYAGQNQYDGYPSVRAFDADTGVVLWESQKKMTMSSQLQ